MPSTDTTNNGVLVQSINDFRFQDRCYRRFLVAAISATTETVNATTSALTASGGTTLTFAAQPPTVAIGWTVQSLTTPASIPAGTLVKSLGATVGLSAAIATAGVAAGDIIVFSPPSHTQRLGLAGSLFAKNIDRQMLALLVMANATNQTNCLADPNNPGGNILDSDIDFQINSIFTGVAVSRPWG